MGLAVSVEVDGDCAVGCITAGVSIVCSDDGACVVLDGSGGGGGIVATGPGGGTGCDTSG